MKYAYTGIIAISLMMVTMTIPGISAASFEDTVQVGDFPRDVDFDYTLNNLYVPNYESGSISVIDSTSMIVKNTIFLDESSNPTKIVVDSGRHLVFVSDKISGVLTILDGVTGKIIDSMKIGDSLWDLDIDESTGKLYVSDLVNNEIIIVDTVTLEIITSINVSASPWDVVVNQNTNLVYAASGTSEEINIIDGRSDSLIGQISPGVTPWGLSINEKSNVLYVSSWDSNSITVIDLSNGSILYEIPVIPGVWQMTTNQNNGVTIISNEHTNELYLLDENSRQFQTINVTDSPQSMTVSPFSNTVYVVNPLENSISSVSYAYESKFPPIIQTGLFNDDTATDELLLEVLDGFSNISQRQDVDSELVSGLLKNVGVTGKFDGNGIASLLIDDYKKKKESLPTSVPTPNWAIDLASMFADESDTYSVPQTVDCDDDFNASIRDTDNLDPFKIWINILPICAMS